MEGTSPPPGRAVTIACANAQDAPGSNLHEGPLALPAPRLLTACLPAPQCCPHGPPQTTYHLSLLTFQLVALVISFFGFDKIFLIWTIFFSFFLTSTQSRVTLSRSDLYDCLSLLTSSS